MKSAYKIRVLMFDEFDTLTKSEVLPETYQSDRDASAALWEAAKAHFPGGTVLFSTGTQIKMLTLNGIGKIYTFPAKA